MTSGKATIAKEKREAPVLLRQPYANRLQYFTPTKPRWDTEDAEKILRSYAGEKINNADAEKNLTIAREKREASVLLQLLYANRLQCFTSTKLQWDTEDAEKPIFRESRAA